MNLNRQITNQCEAGLDEAGRGCLAGPVTAAAVILPLNVKLTGIDDSKKLSAKQRESIHIYIKEIALAWSVTHILPQEIDQINILNASILAMHEAVAKLKVRPEFLAVDGNRFHPFEDIPHQTVIKGDAHYAHIAAASILAKTHRDAFMADLHTRFPQYGWIENKGYPTRKHREAIARFGACEWHRQSFRLLAPEGG